ncbi:oxygen-independent coproporphyrinogen-3 oxidase [Streptomyces sp. SLBN-118]|uniref:radical SAM protein n=1 Tax=Streptomyces sp. SLBN-118 TaxID=2768454 RepID=UPI001150CB86|nr:radical SAM protein [Streptomyces sp. SLBN-118]TQK42748.1 oxygen-independent coproporphyrinogen-3 oxidase [Streptomyces sp. SLBN-118]
MNLSYEQAVASLHQLDPGYPVPSVLAALDDPANRHLLEYVTADPFGAHVFPGDITDYPPSEFLIDLNRQLASTAPIHLWSYIPTCAYRCRFCQYPVVLVKGQPEVTDSKATQWVDWNIREAEMWLREVPNLASAPIGEFNVFGGTPSLLPPVAIRRLLRFYQENFNFTPDTAIRFEGDPSTFTVEKLELLAELGCSKLSSGVQSFDDSVLEQCGREHTAQMCVDFIGNARRVGFEWISIDLMYGLLDQSVDSVRRDLDMVVEHDLTAVVCAKLHLKSFSDTRTGVSGEKPAAWQLPAYRNKLVEDGHRWPTLGEQYQMREILTEGLTRAGFREQPTMYFAREGLGPETWKSIMVDQDKQEAEVAIGLGGSSSCRASEAIAHVDWRTYSAAVEAGRLPLGSATRFSEDAQEARSIKMALSTLQPLRDTFHQQRFAGRSLLDEPWRHIFQSLEKRGLTVVDDCAEQISMTSEGKVLVEAIINSEF